MEKISGVYRITNAVTNDFYIGSSKDVKKRWNEHKCPSKWNEYPNRPMFLDMLKYGVDKFVFEVIEEAEESFLKETEQYFIETLKPTYNNINAKGLDIERRKESQKEYQKTDKRKKYKKEYIKEYQNQLCCYDGKTLTLNALSIRFLRKVLSNPTQEAKKYLIKKESKAPVEFYDVYP